MPRVKRVALVVYVVVLTASLLSPNPFAVAGNHQDEVARHFKDWVAPMAHVISFVPLGFLALANCRWPSGLVAALILLVAYALATEWLQGFIPDRRTDWGDLTQNLAGIAIGAALWCGVRAARRGD